MSKEFIVAVTFWQNQTIEDAQDALQSALRDHLSENGMLARVTVLRAVPPRPPQPAPQRPGTKPAERPFEAVITQRHGYMTADGRFAPERDHSYLVVVTPEGFIFRRETTHDDSPAWRMRSRWQRINWKPTTAEAVQEILDGWRRNGEKSVYIIRNTVTNVTRWER